MKLYSYGFLVIMGVLTVILEEIFNQRDFFYIVKLWFNFRLPAEVLLVITVFSLSVKKGKEKKEESVNS